MGETFNPYRKWLGIGIDEQPPNCYRLLGIPQFEDDPDVISNAADRQMIHLRTFQSGKHSALSQKLLNEVSAAKVSLLDPDKKVRYDAKLRAELDDNSSPSAAPIAKVVESPTTIQRPQLAPRQVSEAPPTSASPAPPNQPLVATVSVAESQKVEEEHETNLHVVSSRKRISSSSRRSRKNNSTSLYITIGTIGVALLIGIIILVISNFTEDSTSKSKSARPSSESTSGVQKSNRNKKSKTKQSRPKKNHSNKDPKKPKDKDPDKKSNPKTDHPKKIDKPKKVDPKKPPKKTEKPKALAIVATRSFTNHEGKQEPPAERNRKKLQRQVRARFSFNEKSIIAGTDEQLEKLISKLFDEAKGTNNDFAYKFALLNEVKMIGHIKANVKVTCLAIDMIDEGFKIDALHEKTTSISKIPKYLSQYKKKKESYIQKNKDLMDKAEAIYKTTVRQERYELAELLAKHAANAAARIRDQRNKKRILYTAEYAANLSTLQTNFRKQLPLYMKNTAAPDACQAVGLFIAVARSNWKEGCQLLLRSSDSQIKAVAKLDLTNPTDTNGQISLANQWFEVAKKNNKAIALVCLIRAKHWYQTASTSATKQPKAEINKRLDNINTQIGNVGANDFR